MIKIENVTTEELKAATLRLKASHRGGGIEISLTPFGFLNQKMTAYQNYLGGGMLGSIQNDCTLSDWEKSSPLAAIAEALSRYFHSITNHEDDEWESATFEENQKRKESGIC